MTGSDKLDFNLQQAMCAFEESGAPHDESAGITVSLRFEDDLVDIEALGFEPIAVYDNQARGVVWFKDILARADTTANVGAGVIVAVIDTGIDYTHPAFMKQLTPKPVVLIQVR